MRFVDPIKEARAVAALRESLAAVDAEDEALLLDTIEGQTQLLEIVDKLLERMAADEAFVLGLEGMIERMEARKARFSDRIKTDRALIEQAMSIAELKKLERPSATLTLSNRPPSLQVTEASEIPALYWKAGSPTLDKKALTAALSARAKAIQAGAVDVPPEIPGATLTNGAPSLSLRRA